MSVNFTHIRRKKITCQWKSSLPRRRFYGSSSFIPPHKRLLNRKQHSFPKLSQSHCTFRILEGWPWPHGNLIITRSAWNTGKAFWLLINVWFWAAKVRFSQILDCSIHCITLATERKEGKRWLQGHVLVLFSLSTLYFKTVDWSLTTQIKQCERNVVFGWAGVCEEGWKTNSPKNACVGG